MIALKNKKGENEIISTILIMLIMVIVVGVIITGVTSQISKGKEKTNYDNSVVVRDQLFTEIIDLYNSPIEATNEITFSLSNLELTIDSDTETIEICSIGKKFDFFDEGKRVEQDNNKYIYRELQKVCAGVAFGNIDLVRSYQISNRENLRLVIKKITENKIQFSLDNETAAEWYTQKNEYVYDENAGEWLYRKKILITSNTILGDLNNIPITITLTDEDIKSYAKVDGSDLLFTLSDGITKIKKEIVDYNSETGELTTLLTIPSFNIGPDVNVYGYGEKTRKKITIDHTKVDGDLTDFPMLISIKDENLVSLAKEDGSDIYFTASDGTTKLKREIESFTDNNLFRKKITIDHTKVDASLTDFPVLVSITDSDLASLGVNTDGNDIYFTTSNRYTRLKREIEDYNSETGALVAWVKVPSLSSTTDTDIYMHFGNEDENNSNDTDVWDGNYAMVQHFNNSTLDSTANNIDGNITGSLTLIEDRFGKDSAYKFEPGKYIRIPKPFDQNKYEQIWTVDAWYKISNKGTTQSIFKYNSCSGFNCGLHLTWSTTQNSLLYLNATTANDYYTYGSGTYISTDTWQKITYKFRNSDGYRKIYINGVDRTTSGPNATSTPSGVASTVIIGDVFTGELDELRISTTLRSDSWIKTEYNNQNTPEDFYTVGDLEDVTINLVAWVKVPSLSSTTDTDIYMYFGDENESNTNDTDVWDSNFAMVQHFNNNVLDSTSYANNGTAYGSPTYSSGTLGNNLYLDGNNDYIGLGTKSLDSPLQMRNGIVTVQHWINPESWTATTKYLFLGSAGGGWRGYGTRLSSSTGQYGFEVYGETGGRQSSALNLGIGVSQWNQITTIFDGVNNQIITYYNGVLKTPYNFSEPGDVNSTSQFIIGTHISTGYYNGLIDEVRVSNIARSESWIKTEYNNQSSPSTFYSVGEMADANVVVLTTPTAANANTGVYMYFGNPDANISDYDIGDGNIVNVTIGVLEKS